MLLVDASEGPLPQTRFVLRKALERRLPPMVVINKIDRPDARVQEVLNEVYDLFIDLDATEEQLDFPVLYTSAKAGTASMSMEVPGEDLRPLFDAIIEHVPPPRGSATGRCRCWSPTSTRATTWDASPIGRIFNGTRQGRRPDHRLQARRHVQRHQGHQALRVRRPEARRQSTEAVAGDIVCLAGIEDITIGETIADVEHRRRCRSIAIDEPTVSMIFGVNTSPMSGRDGQFVTSRQIKDRLDKELLGNVSIRVEPTDTPEQMKVLGRGELQLSILIEMMRREGFEMQVSRPDIVTKDGQRQGDGAGRGSRDRRRRGLPGRRHRAGRHAPRHDDQDGQPRQRPRAARVPHPGARPDRLPLAVPDRDQGHRHHEPHLRRLGAVARRDRVARDRRAGRPIAPASTTAYAIWNLQERGEMFIEPAEKVYEGMIVGENARDTDMDVNITKEKKQTNMRASSADEAIRLIPPRKLGLEQAIEFINDDELVEVTPKSIRLRKRVLAGEHASEAQPRGVM